MLFNLSTLQIPLQFIESQQQSRVVERARKVSFKRLVHQIASSSDKIE